MLKGKPRHIKIYRSSFQQTLVLIGSTKLKVFRSALLTEAKGKTFPEKIRGKAKKLSDWLQLRRLPYLEKAGWLFVISCSSVLFS